jgi:ectoine hydroxylase-related dioxygenase (phytanoyl-CoA dioxygenase family)
MVRVVAERVGDGGGRQRGVIQMVGHVADDQVPQPLAARYRPVLRRSQAVQDQRGVGVRRFLRQPARILVGEEAFEQCCNPAAVSDVAGGRRAIVDRTRLAREADPPKPRAFVELPRAAVPHASAQQYPLPLVDLMLLQRLRDRQHAALDDDELVQGKGPIGVTIHGRAGVDAKADAAYAERSKALGRRCSGQDTIDQFHRDGVLVVRDVLDVAELAALRSDVDDTVAKGVAMEGEGHSHRRVDGRDRYVRTDGVWAYGKAFRDITVKPEILAIVGQLLGHPFVPVNDTIVVKLPRSDVPIDWHQDPPYAGANGRAATFGVPNFDIDIYLDRATVDTGCLYAIAGHHLVGHVELERFTDDELFERDDAVPLELGPGDVLVHAITAPHGSRANVTDDLRRVVYVHYMAREVLEQLHGEWADGRGFGPAGIARLAHMIDDAGVVERLAARDVWFDDDGLTSVGSPTTRRHHWRALSEGMAPDEVSARKTLQTTAASTPSD